MRSSTGLLVLTLGFTMIVTISADLDLVLVHTNDLHSHFDEMDVYCNECREDDAARGLCYGGLARVAHVAEYERKLARDKGLPSLFMVAGDTFQGTPYYSFFKWRPVIDFVQQLRPDVMTLGNHEFDDGVKNLVSFLDGIKGIPTVVSNLNTTMVPELDKFLLPSIVFTFNGTKVGVVGYLTTDTPSISNPENVGFFDEVESLKKETKKLRESGVNIIICLGHGGIEMDQIIAREVEDIDLIVGGHSHTLLWSGKTPSIEKPYGPYPLFVTNAKNKSVPILQVYANSKYMGKVHLHFDSKGDLVTIDGSPTLLNKDIRQDPSMLAIVDKWRPNVTDLSGGIVGHTVVKLLDECSEKECNIGNIITDSYVYYNILKYNKQDGDHRWTDAPIALHPSGSIRTSIDATDHDGLITFGQLINVMPFMKRLVKVTVKGTTLLEAFEHGVSDYNATGSLGIRLLQMSGAFIKYDLTRSVGNRVVSLLLRCGDCRIPKYEPLVLNASYTILMNEYLANGGDDFRAFKKTSKLTQIIDVDDVNATATYMTHTSPIMTGLDGRITFKVENNDKKSGSSAIQTLHSKLLLLTICALLSYNFLNFI